jgi:regulator of protease activity HflC (stomatin/prohibitin superfamily)
MDVQVMFHIPMEQASAVVADLGSMADLISQVLEPAVSSHFRNAAQTVKALDLYTKRAELAEAAKNEISQVLGRYHIESRDVMITDVVLPEELTKPVRQASVASQEKEMYNAQKNAQEARKDFEHAQKEADMQDKLVESARSVEISKNNASAAIEKATGDKTVKILDAEAQSTFIIQLADARAHETVVKGEADARVTLKNGQSKAEAYRLSQLALGDDFARMQIIEAIAKNGLPIIPQNIIIGGENGGGVIENFLGISMIEKLTGKPFNGDASNHSAPVKSFIEDEKTDKPETETTETATEAETAQVDETASPSGGEK